MNSIWNKNFEAFKKRFPALAQYTGSDPVAPESLWQLDKAKNGMITASENGVRLHSAYNPEREALGAVNREEVFEKSNVVFYGFGLGYHVIEWAKTAALRKDKSEKKIPKLLLLEPDINHFYASMGLLDWSPVFALDNLIIAVGASVDSLLPLLEDSSSVNIGDKGVSDAYYFDIPAFTAHAKNYFDTVRSLIKRNQRKNEINAATLKKFGRRWCRNSIRNLLQLEKTGFISPLQGKLKNSKNTQSLPFLIIGAGPSLENILPYIKQLQKRMITVCVETALHTLLRSGIQPDFVIITDPQFWAYRHIAALSAPDSILISELSAYPAVFRFSCNNILLCSSQFPIGQYVQNKLNLNPGDLGSGGSVASSAWNFAYYCGAKEIYTAGLDFAFPKGQTHIKGSSAEQTWHTLSNRLSAADKYTAAALYSANASLAKDYKGETVITDSRMKMFSWWFESRLANCTDVQTYTFCPQGLATPGIKTVEILDILKEPFSEEIAKEKADFIKLARSIKTELSSEQKKELTHLQKCFSSPESLPEDFVQAFSFLKEYF